MFFITNHESCVIAADTDFLDKIRVDNIYSATLLIQNGNIKIDELEKSIIYLEESDSFVRTRLNTLFGDVYLYKLNIQDKEQKDESFSDDDLLNLAVLQTGLVGNTIDKTEDASPEADDNIFELLDEDDEAIDSSSELEKELSTSDEKVDDFPEIAETTSNQVSDETESYQSSSSIDTKEAADLIGIPADEYAKFLEEFRSEASKLESDLRNNDFMKSREATVSLKEASLLLHLPHIAEKLSELSNATSEEKESVIDDFMALVASTDTNNNAKEMIASTNETTIKDEASLFEDQETNTSDKESADISSSTQLVDMNINLDDIQAIPFDFSINEAADDLTLPTSLVSEFIIDFIGLAKDNLPVLQQAYKDQDLDALQSTAHMLKGASSNLRIKPMADTLYSLQFNDDLIKTPELIKRLSGQLKALSIQMEQ